MLKEIKIKSRKQFHAGSTKRYQLQIYNEKSKGFYVFTTMYEPTSLNL